MMTMHAAVGMVLFFGGLVGTVVNMIYLFSTATYVTTRPWAGLRSRARRREDGSTYVQTYHSKGPTATKARMKTHWSSWVCLVAFWVGIFWR